MGMHLWCQNCCGSFFFEERSQLSEKGFREACLSKRIECHLCGVNDFLQEHFSFAYDSILAYISEQENSLEHLELKKLAEDCRNLHDDGDANSADENAFTAKYKTLYKACKELGRHAGEENPEYGE